MKRRFIDATTEQRCVWTVKLADGSAAQCGRHKKVGDLCTQHHKMHDAMAFPCCGRLDEQRPIQFADCENAN